MQTRGGSSPPSDTANGGIHPISSTSGRAARFVPGRGGLMASHESLTVNRAIDQNVVQAAAEFIHVGLVQLDENRRLRIAPVDVTSGTSCIVEITGTGTLIARPATKASPLVRTFDRQGRLRLSREEVRILGGAESDPIFVASEADGTLWFVSGIRAATLVYGRNGHGK